jgi:glycosyltransferase involved in cell wall biosynthesis
MVEWGEELALSRALIAEEGLAERVHWIPPAPRQRLWTLMAGAAGVLDQFAASAFGGVGLEAMALGKPVISRIEGAELGPFFATPPPIRHAATPEQVAEAIQEVLSVPGAAARLGEAGRAWMATEHGVERQLALQFAACERLIARFGPAA